MLGSNLRIYLIFNETHVGWELGIVACICVLLKYMDEYSNFVIVLRLRPIVPDDSKENYHQKDAEKDRLKFFNVPWPAPFGLDIGHEKQVESQRPFHPTRKRGHIC